MNWFREHILNGYSNYDSCVRLVWSIIVESLGEGKTREFRLSEIQMSFTAKQSCSFGPRKKSYAERESMSFGLFLFFICYQLSMLNSKQVSQLLSWSVSIRALTLRIFKVGLVLPFQKVNLELLEVWLGLVPKSYWIFEIGNPRHSPR